MSWRVIRLLREKSNEHEGFYTPADGVYLCRVCTSMTVGDALLTAVAPTSGQGRSSVNFDIGGANIRRHREAALMPQ